MTIQLTLNFEQVIETETLECVHTVYVFRAAVHAVLDVFRATVHAALDVFRATVHTVLDVFRAEVTFDL